MFDEVEKTTYHMLRYGVFRLWVNLAPCREAMKKVGITDIESLAKQPV